ncbi:MAG: YdeI/OmpD-associated family protein [Sphingomicrobium sp.]
MNRDPRVDAYVAKAQPFAQPILSHVRNRVHAIVPDVEEAIKWGMPAYTRGGAILLITAAFKAHAALNFWRGGEIGDGSAKAGAMGQLGKIASLDDLPADLDHLIVEAARLAALAPAPRKPKAAPKASADPHPAFAEALAANPGAQAHFDAFAPSHRREYIDWINSAKRDETRAKRIASALDWIGQGRKQNWRYEQ